MWALVGIVLLPLGWSTHRSCVQRPIGRPLWVRADDRVGGNPKLRFGGYQEEKWTFLYAPKKLIGEKY